MLGFEKITIVSEIMKRFVRIDVCICTYIEMNLSALSLPSDICEKSRTSVIMSPVARPMKVATMNRALITRLFEMIADQPLLLNKAMTFLPAVLKS